MEDIGEDRVEIDQVKARATEGGMAADRIERWQKVGKHAADLRAQRGAAMHPRDEDLRRRSKQQDRLVSNSFRWIGRAMQAGHDPITAEDGEGA